MIGPGVAFGVVLCVGRTEFGPDAGFMPFPAGTTPVAAVRLARFVAGMLVAAAGVHPTGWEPDLADAVGCDGGRCGLVGRDCAAALVVVTILGA